VRTCLFLFACLFCLLGCLLKKKKKKRVWDCERLHTIVTNRSRLTCKLQKGQINSVATIRNTHSVASACNLGTVHVFNIEHQRKVEKSFSKTIYTGIQTVRFIDRSEGSIFDVRNFEVRILFPSLLCCF
jgi:hypothetical protein